MKKVQLPFALFFTFYSSLSFASESIVAHRGVYQNFSRENLGSNTCTAERIYKPAHSFLENTIPSIAEAFRLGADMVEIDVHATIDGQVVVFHDWKLECRTNGKGVTEEQTFAYLRSLDVGYGYTHDKHKTHPFRCRPGRSDYRECMRRNRIPSLEEVLRRFPDKNITINMKSGSRRVLKTILSELKRINKEHGYDLSQILFFCSKQEILDQARKEIPSMTVPKLNWRGIKKCLKGYFLSGQFDSACQNAVFAVPYPEFRKMGPIVAKKIIASIHKINGKFGVIRVNTTDAYQYVHQLGVDGIWTDKIEVIAKIAKRKSSP